MQHVSAHMATIMYYNYKMLKEWLSAALRSTVGRGLVS